MEKQYEPITVRVNPKEDFILKEILSRVHEKRRNEFVREAMFYWDYIVKHSSIGTWHLKVDTSQKQIIDNLFPEEYFIIRKNPDMSLKEKFKDIDIKTLRFEVGADETELQEICSRVVSLEGFIKEAIFEWDCLLNTSNIFLSRFIQRKKGSTPTWHISTGEVTLNKNIQLSNPYKQSDKKEETIKDSTDSSDTVTTSNNTEENKNIDLITDQNKEINTSINNTVTAENVEKTNSTQTRGRKNGLKW